VGGAGGWVRGMILGWKVGMLIPGADMGL